MTETSIQSSHTNKQAIPLCIDLDGTLTYTDTLYESLLVLLTTKPLTLLLLPFWLLKGKAYLKSRIAGLASLEISLLPYNQTLIKQIKLARSQGRKTLLVTASHEITAREVAQHLKLFDEVIASDANNNLIAEKKLAAIKQSLGDTAFDYAGNSSQDIPIWQQSQTAIVVNASKKIINQAKQYCDDTDVISKKANPLKETIRAIRIYQWPKNLLIFFHLALGHNIFNPALALDTLLAFIAFCFCASSVYLSNDLLDLNSDRSHHDKYKRPFASGHLSIISGLLLAPLLLLISIIISLQLSPYFFATIALYFLITLAYSLWIKRQVIIDLLTLAALYTLRIIAGAAVMTELPSFWLIAFSMFIFTSLAVAKRFSELRTLQELKLTSTRGRGYNTDDAMLLQSLGISSGYLAVLVLALYINSEQVTSLYKTPEAIWLLCPLIMYWISRLWMIAHRGQLNEDPVVFALTDKSSYFVLLISFIIIAFAI